MKPWENGALSVSDDRRYLLNGDTPFFWLGDTAWTLMQRLDSEQSRVYLKNRADKGFNVIQAVLTNLAGFKDGGTDTGNVHVYEEDLDQFISSKNDVYWKHVDEVVGLAQDMGIYFAFLPVWGRFAKSGFVRQDNVERYARFLAKRFNRYENIIWILGGDIRGSEHFEMWNMLGNSLKLYSPGKLIGYHPFGRTSSSYWFNECDWLDFNMFQSGHRRYDQKNLFSWDEAAKSEPWFGEDNWRYVVADMAKTPLRPVLDGEPSYEQIPQGLHDFSQPCWQEHHVRRYAYWSVLSGACGHTYGDNSVMQFFGTGAAPSYGAIDTWDVAIHHSGSGQMTFLKKLMIEIDFTHCIPMQKSLDCVDGVEHDRICVFGNEKVLVAYDYCGREFSVAFNETMDAWWFDPADSARSYIGRFDLSKSARFCPPVKKNGHNDWVLILKK